MKKYLLKKIMTSIILVGLIVPNRSFAIFGIGDIVNDPITNAEQIIAMIKEYGLDQITTILSQVMSSKLSNKILNKANGGASGDSAQPSYIQNFGKYFSDLGLAQIDKFVTDLEISNNPYVGDIAKSIIQGAQGLSSGKSALDSFNLDKIIGSNYKDFATDASIGGWDGILALSNPANTNIGASLIANQELANKITNEIDTEKIKLTSSGTKPQGKCNLDFTKYKQQIQGIKDNRNDLQFTQEALNNGETLYNDDGTEIDLGQLGNYVQGTRSNIASNSITLGEEYGGCLQELINNPVSLVTNSIGGALDAGAEKLAASDEAGEAIAGMLLELANKFIKAGLSVLSADFQSNRDAIGGPEQLVAKNGQQIPWTQTPNTIIDLSEEFQPTITATEKEVTNLRAYLEAISTSNDNDETFANVITGLDQCIPGPDYGFRKRLTAYISKQTKKLDKRKDKGKDEKTIVKNNALDNIDASIDTAKTYMELAMSTKNRNIPAAEIMISEVASIDEIRLKYQDTKSELSKKQITLNLLYSLEGGLQASIQSLQGKFVDMPQLIPFTTSGWDRLSNTQKIAVVNWAKNIGIIISNQNTPGITTADIPLTTADWNTLSSTKKTALVKWAENQTNSVKKTSTSDKDFVLAAVWLSAGLQANIPETDIKKSFVIATTWKVWSNPENYMATPWDTESSEAKVFLKQKNEIRTNYNALLNDVSIPYTAQKAENSLKQLQVIMSQAEKLRDDCQTLRILVNQNRFDTQDPEAHNKLRTVLQQNINRFKSQEMIDAINIRGNGGILDIPPVINLQNDFRTYGITNCDNQSCYDNSDLVGLLYGNDDNDGSISDSQRQDWTKYQIQPAKNIWELLDQKQGDNDTAFCGFNGFLNSYPDMLPNRTLDGGRSIICSNDWNRIDKTTVRTIIFSTDLKDEF